MALATHDDRFRRLWMFPRNIRKIYPHKMSEILPLFLSVGQEWVGKQAAQDAFCKTLEAYGLKRPGDQYDAKSGGPRTYFSQFVCLGFLFLRENGRFYLTKAGEDLANGKPPLPIMRAQLLRHQYPSVYSSGRNVRINPQIRVKPFLFVLRLLEHESIRYLTNEELVVPVVFGHNDSCLDTCVEKILKIRGGASIFDLANPEDYHLPRALPDKAHVAQNLSDIANTCKNYMESCRLVDIEVVEGGKNRIIFCEDAREAYREALKKQDSYIPLTPVTSDEAFQRAYGAWDRVKDTRSLDSPTVKKQNPLDLMILSKFYSFCGTRIVAGMPDDFLGSMKNDLGLDVEKVKDVVFPHLATALSYYESRFIELSHGGASLATQFELAICELFQEKLHFKARHTGQLARPSGVGGYADAFLIDLDDSHCALIDAKASPGYKMSTADFHAMRNNYIPNHTELTHGKGLSLEFVTYIAGGFAGDIKFKLSELSKDSSIACSGVKARDILTVAMKNPSKEDQPAIRTALKSGGVITESDFQF